MKTYKTNPEQIEQLIHKLMNINNHDKLLSSSLLQELSTDEVTVLTARLDDNFVGSSRYLTGYAKLKTPIVAEKEELHVETEYIHFWFDIYFVDKILNEMCVVEPFFPLSKKLRETDMDRATDAQLLIERLTPWGPNGRYKCKKTKDLSGDDLARRLFTNNMQNVSRKYQWGQEARKLFSKQNLTLDIEETQDKPSSSLSR